METQPSQQLLSRMPMPGSTLVVSMQINDMFLLGLTDEQLADAINAGDAATLAAHLYRVQRLSIMDYSFKKHTCTVADTTNEQMANGNYIRVNSFKGFASYNPVKVKVDKLGVIGSLQKVFNR